MAWFLQFYDAEGNVVGRRYTLDWRDAGEDRPFPEERLQSSILTFQREHGVDDWRKAAANYRTLDADYL